MRVRLLAAAVALLLAATGCSATSSSADAPSPQPTIESATPQEVASVLAEYEPDWREVVDEAGECRITWVLGEGLTDELRGMSCYLSEQTAGFTAQLVVRDWAALSIPTSMQDLVDRTSSTLSRIGAIDLQAVCGDGSLPNEAQECSDAIGMRMNLYRELEGHLNAWAPYL